MKKLAIAMALASVLGIAQARSAAALIEPERVVLIAPAGALTAEKVKVAIVRGGARHDWVVQAETPGKVRLKFNKQNKHEVVVDVTYDADGFQIRYVSSVNMKYELENGVAVIHPFYNKWVFNLGKAISAEANQAN